VALARKRGATPLPKNQKRVRGEKQRVNVQENILAGRDGKKAGVHVEE